MNEEEKLKNYLAKAVQDGDLEQVVADLAIQTWQALPKTLSMPDAAATPDGCLLYTWNNGMHHLEVEIYPSGYEGLTELFYMNRETDEKIDTDYTVGQPMPEEFTAKFGLFSATPQADLVVPTSYTAIANASAGMLKV